MYFSAARHQMTQHPRRQRTLGDIVKLESGQWPMEKQRRSEIDWYALVPEGVAIKQMGWERRQTVLAMRQAGVTQKKIGELFGITAARVHGLEQKALRDQKRGYPKNTPPVQQYYDNVLFYKSYCAKTRTWVAELKSG